MEVATGEPHTGAFREVLAKDPFDIPFERCSTPMFRDLVEFGFAAAGAGAGAGVDVDVDVDVATDLDTRGHAQQPVEPDALDRFWEIWEGKEVPPSPVPEERHQVFGGPWGPPVLTCTPVATSKVVFPLCHDRVDVSEAVVRAALDIQAQEGVPDFGFVCRVLDTRLEVVFPFSDMAVRSCSARAICAAAVVFLREVGWV
jgi:hypothetical protein